MSSKHKYCDSLLVLYVWMAVAARIEGSCDQGWFGPNCTFMCHCTNSSTCDQVSGECGTNIECSPGWFGPGCQYDEISMTLWSINSPAFLTDGTTSSCNPDRKALELNITLGSPIRIFWIRIQTDIDMSSYNLEFELAIGNCSDKKLFRVSETILDINCDATHQNSLFIVRGMIVGHICDIKFSGGRNLALRQQASQSSDFSGLDLRKVQASNAVDGSRKDTCTQTDQISGRPWWSLQFNFYCTMPRVVLYTSRQHKNRLTHYSLELFNSTWMPYGCTQVIFAPTVRHILLLPWGQDRANKIKVHTKEDPNVGDNFFSLCEVEVYGDYICPVEKWGLSCENSCKCGPYESCSQVTGACSSPCFSRRQVFNATTLQCVYQCYPNCVSAVCEVKEDCPLCSEEQCLTCRPGFYGAFCKLECPKGMFGENCSSHCSSDCSDSRCNSVSGDCLACPDNRVLPRCLEKAPEKDKENDTGFDYSYLLVLVVLLPILCCICFYLFGKKHAKTAEHTKVPEEPGAEDKALPEERLSQAGSSVDVERDQKT